MKKLAFLSVLLFTLGFVSAGWAAVIDIIELGNGMFRILSDNSIYATVSTRKSAELVANKLKGKNNSVHWYKEAEWKQRWDNTQTSGNTTSKTNSGNTESGLQKSPNTASTQSTGTGQKTPSGGMPRKTTPATTNPVSTQSADTGQKALPAPKATTATPKVNVGNVALGVLGVAAGAIGMADSVKSKDTKTTLGDVATGAMGGATFASGAAAITNAIPVGGQIAYGAAMAVGAVVGASGAGAKMFSETDCENDPVTGQYACCNVSKLTNIQARYCNIGDEMFAKFPYVRTCMQGNNKFESNWFKARFLDDHWSSNGEVKFCTGYQMPAKGDYHIQTYGSSEAAGKVCWKWECADAGMKRQGNKCVSDKQSKQCKDAEVSCSNSQTKMGATKQKKVTDTQAVQVQAYDDDEEYKEEEARRQSTQEKICKTIFGATWSNGQCVCIDSDKEMNTDGTACVETAEARRRREEAAREAAREASKANISAIVNEINTLKAGLSISVWKDKEGNFNTSRLVSDSVAGVVLGTAGGLITSKVMKKNQLKGGFEDISCTIRGQEVAGYGDDFQVGIQ